VGGIWGMVDGFDFTVLKHRKIKTFQGNNFTVSSALVIKLKVVEWCLTVKN
jgi:hypothetical protein